LFNRKIRHLRVPLSRKDDIWTGLIPRILLKVDKRYAKRYRKELVNKLIPNSFVAFQEPPAVQAGTRCTRDVPPATTGRGS